LASLVRGVARLSFIPQPLEQKMPNRLVVVVLIGLSGLVLLGCGHRLPPVVLVKGKVLLDGKPLPKASVTFMPLLDNFGAESNSNAVTDEDGRFTLTCLYNKQSGAVVGTHVVLVAESPLPDELRKGQNSRVIDDYRAKLGNRPIPPRYSSVSQSPIKIEIKEGQEPVTIELTR
jgi:hypothetical protein